MNAAQGPAPCDFGGYSRRFVRFVQAHREEYETAYLAPTPSTSRQLLERLRREYVTLPPRHICTCWCSVMRQRDTGMACTECQRRRRQAVNDSTVEIGRSAAVTAPMPLVVMLDMEAGYAA